jgi:site-specific recombinase XerD
MRCFLFSETLFLRFLLQNCNVFATLSCMKTTRSRKEGWPRRITLGRTSVTIYKRAMPNGSAGFMVANYSGEKRRFDSYATEADALDAANKLARQLSQRNVLGASMTKEQSIEYASAVQTLQPLGVSLTSAVSTLAEAVKLVGDLSGVTAAAKFYKARNKTVAPKRVADVVAELIKVKASRNASERYLSDLRGRLNKFAEAFQKDTCNVTTEDIQAWLDNLKSLEGVKLSNATYGHSRQVLHLFFNFAVARGYAHDNPVVGVERVKVKHGATLIFKPEEIAKLLAAATAEFLPALAISAFAGLRSAEVERLEWGDIDLTQRHIVLSAEKAKTASRRIIPIHDNLAAWLAPYAGRKGKVWTGGWLYKAQGDCAAATEVKADEENGVKAQAAVKWKQNALRHSYASYRLAQTQNAAQVALECGNSPQMIFAHYREIVRPVDAQRWFNVKPERPANVVMLNAATAT